MTTPRTNRRWAPSWFLALVLGACEAKTGEAPLALHEVIAPIAYDSARAVTPLFGGFAGVQAGQTWEWNGSQWISRPVSGPGSREGHTLVFDSARGVSVLFGGFIGNGVSGGDTWEWDGSDWIEASPGGGPTPRTSHAMAFDSARGVTVLFGGRALDLDNQTWEWDGNDWVLRPTSAFSTPAPRSRHAMAYDSARGVSVLFGGYAGKADDETWEWDGNAWTRFIPTASEPSAPPSKRYLHAMAYDSLRGVTVLFGGFDGSFDGETWEWTGGDWSLRSSSGPSPRAGHGMAFDEARGVTVLYGGFDGTYRDETWEWDGSAWTQRLPSLAGPGERVFVRVLESTLEPGGAGAAASDRYRELVLDVGPQGARIVGDLERRSAAPGAPSRVPGP